MKNFKNEKLLNNLNKATIGKQIGNESESREENDAYSPDENGYYTFEDSDLESDHFGYSQDQENDFEVDEEEFRKYQEKYQN